MMTDTISDNANAQTKTESLFTIPTRFIMLLIKLINGKCIHIKRKECFPINAKNLIIILLLNDLSTSLYNIVIMIENMKYMIILNVL